MGNTFVNISGRGFWIYDGPLEVWLRLLALHIEDPLESGTVASTIRDQWLLASRGYFNGCVPDGLDEAVSSEEGEKVVRIAVNSLMKALNEAPGRLGPEVFNLMGMSGTFIREFETERLIEVGRKFLDLIDGKSASGPGDESFTPES
jgi:hypothetical protein